MPDRGPWDSSLKIPEVWVKPFIFLVPLEISERGGESDVICISFEFSIFKGIQEAWCEHLPLPLEA